MVLTLKVLTKVSKNNLYGKGFDEGIKEQPLWEEGFKDKIVVTYAGAVGKANALEYFLSSHEFLNEPTKFMYLILGAGSELNLRNLCI